MEKMSFTKRLVLGFLLLGGLGLSSCKNDDVDIETDETIDQVIATNTNFTMLQTALTRAELTNALSAADITLFAPTNDAFEAAGFTTQDINDLSIEELQNILSYHVVDSRLSSANIENGAELPTLINSALFASNNEDGVAVNGIEVTNADQAASNGVIHVIDYVLMPPSSGVVDMVMERQGEDDEFSYFLAAVERAELQDALNATMGITVFVPTNEAFREAGFPTIADIQSADQETLTQVLSYHVLESRVFAFDVTQAMDVPTLLGEDHTIAVSKSGSTVQLRGTGNDSDAEVGDRVNWVATNGVIHVIDGVLMP